MHVLKNILAGVGAFALFCAAVLGIFVALATDVDYDMNFEGEGLE